MKALTKKQKREWVTAWAERASETRQPLDDFDWIAAWIAGGADGHESIQSELIERYIKSEIIKYEKINLKRNTPLREFIARNFCRFVPVWDIYDKSNGVSTYRFFFNPIPEWSRVLGCYKASKLLRVTDS